MNRLSQSSILTKSKLLLYLSVICTPVGAMAESEGGIYTAEASLRSRYEHADWFGGGAASHDYNFGHTKALFGLQYKSGPFTIYSQGQHFQLYNLQSDRAGPGGVYFSTNGGDENPGSLSLRQLSAAFEDDSLSAKAGRFLYSSGSESPPKNPALLTLRTGRVTQRLIGPFDFTAGRSFDGARITLNPDYGPLTALFVMPTQGGFEADLNRTIDDIKLITFSWTAPFGLKDSATSDAQLFTYLYTDERDAIKPDNRPLEVRASDRGEIEIATFGGHWSQILQEGDYPSDALVWGAGQAGKWGLQDHSAFAYTAELGMKAARLSWKPEARIGYTFGSGDNDPADGDHQTFFQLLPTARAYAATPLYNMQNISDLFLQLSAQPATPLKIKSSLRTIHLSEGKDFLYGGGGANKRTGAFGYSVVSGGGAQDIGTLLDFEAALKITDRISVSLYYARLFGGGAASFAAGNGDDDIDYFFTELTMKAY